MKINEELLLELFHAPAMSGQEVLVQELIKNKLNEMGISFKEDDLGNIYHFDGEKPLLMAHMDTVQDTDDVALSPFIKKRGKLISGYGVIGGDDKNGIYIILHLLKEGYDVNFAFTVQEEVGGHGSFGLAQDKYKEIYDSLYAIILDRRGNDDIICYQNDYGTKKFQEKLEEVGKEFGYSPGRGTFSDADQINEIVSSANLSVGYHNAHTKTEFVHLDQLKNALNFTRKIVEEVNEHYEAPEITYYSRTHKKKNKTSSGYYGHFYDDWPWDDEMFDEFYGTESIDDTYTKDMCIFCGNKENENLFYLPSLQQYVCSDCIIKFYEDTYDIAANNYMSRDDIEEIIGEFEK